MLYIKLLQIILMQVYKNLGLMFFFHFQPVIVIHKGQVVLHVMIVVYAVVTLISSMTNVMHVLLVIQTFLHVQVSNTMQ